MKWFLICLLICPQLCFSQIADTLNGFETKISGEEINYFSPLHQFARTALLTRMNGEMPTSFLSPVYSGTREMVCYEFLLGHSTGTSSGERHFDISLNDKKLFTITTPMKKKGKFELEGKGENTCSYHFIFNEYDANADAFGKLFITVPASMVNQKAAFTITGEKENSRDWLMIFMYKKGLKILAQPTNLVTFKESKRQLNVFVDNPYPSASLEMRSKAGSFQSNLQTGYNKIDIAAYPIHFSGPDTIQFIVNRSDTIYRTLELKPVKNFVFCIIHHSHNDIGYSNLQTEVEEIQNNNIGTAIHWINANKNATEKPIWHIESLWAVENFLRVATPDEKKNFVNAVKSGQLVLSSNYANILTGLCQQEEANWIFEYAKKLEKQYGFHIRNGMITDIPGISYSGLLAYVNNDIPYLSLGPNYVESLPDKGDRVGAVMREQGDKVFYWKPNMHSDKKLLVWTAGKGYSFFHGIADSEKEQAWEKRISDYCNELTEKNYPYDLVQLRYTKYSDNGPVDTELNSFVEHWNKKYITPKLRICSVNDLFSEFEKKYGSFIPVVTGEISPYWEDGAYSTAIEEIQNRELAMKTIAMEKFAKANGRLADKKEQFYLLHKNIVMFHEHTWGAWSSISDPETFFTKEQWRIKKQFVDSAQWYYDQLAAALHFQYNKPVSDIKNNLRIANYSIDKLHGGIETITIDGKNIVSSTSPYKFFEPVYALGINPTKFFHAVDVIINAKEDSPDKKITEVIGTLPSMAHYTVVYTLFRKEGRLVCHYIFDKIAEKEKESFHIALPFSFDHSELEYGNDTYRIRFGPDQLPGSNKDFICVEKNLWLHSGDIVAKISSPDICPYEVGSIIDETKTNGVKIWKAVNDNTSNLFLYVFNNYWHTNYKAYQEGHFDFEVELSFSKRK